MKRRVAVLVFAALLLCLLPVAAQAETGNALTLSQSDALLYLPRSLTLRAAQEEGFREEVTWTSSNPDVAAVSRYGSVSAKSVGTAVITASVPSGATASCRVTVEVGARSVSLSAPETTLYQGLAGVQFAASVQPADTTNKAITWESSDPAIASVDAAGFVTPLKAGSVRITATAASGAKRYVRIHVRIPTSGITLDKTEMTAFAGKSTRLRATVTPSNAFIRRVTWTSSDPAVATVNSGGTVVGRKEGTAVITASTAQGQTAACVVHVEVGARSLTLKAESNTIYVGMGGTQISATVSPEDTTNKTVVWSSSNPDVAAVDANGYVTPVGLGSARIMAETANGIRRTQTIHVRIPATIVELKHAELTAYAGKSVRIPAVVGPSNAYNRRLTWSSSDPSVATVNSSGTVTGRKEGTAIITATTSAGVSARCTVRVEVGARSIALTAPERAVYLGEGGLQLTAGISPENTTNKTVTWTSSRPEVATVSASGVVRAVSSGSVVITATASNGVRRSISIRSYLPPASVAIKQSELTVALNRTGRLAAEVQPAEAFSKKVTWISTDTSIATVNQSGTVSGRKVGSCRIIARDVRGHEASCTVYVEIPVASLSLDAKSVTVVRGGSMRPQVAIRPADATNTHLTLTSADPGVAAVRADGTIAGVRSGSTTVTISSVNGRTAALNVRVVDPAESISLDRGTLSVESGKSVQLNANVLPATAGDRSVSWSVSDPKVAVVTPDGRVIGHKAGTCTVTAHANGGINLNAVCRVTVTGQPNKLIALTFDGTMSDNSARILNVLNRYGVKATFFLVGNDASYTYKSVLLQMVAAGHEIGNHTHTHPHLDQVSLNYALNDIRICDEIIEDITGKKPTIFRAPYGRSTAALASADKRPDFIWNADSLDWKYQSANNIYNRVIGGAKHMGVVLMHQTIPATAEALERILPKLIEEGYDFITCTELYNMVDGKSAYPNTYYFLAVR